MWALRPSYYDNDMPIDLRKKVVLQRDLEEQKEIRRSEDIYEPKDYSLSRYKERCPEPPLLPVQKLSPFVSERYGSRCHSLVNPEINTSSEHRSTSRGSLETAIRKLHFNSKLKQASEDVREERCKSIGALLESKKENVKEKSPSRSNSCPDLSNLALKFPHRHQTSRDNDHFNETYSYDYNKINESSIKYSNSIKHSPMHSYYDSSPIIGGAKKRKSFTPVYGDRIPSPRKIPISPEHQPYEESVYGDRIRSPRKIPRSPEHQPYEESVYGDRIRSPRKIPISPEHQPYEEYFSHPEIILRQQLQQHNTSPYLIHVYDYYQQLVQRLRDHSTTNVRMHVPDSPTPTEDDMHLDAHRKRPCRALTGKHVKQGTGASISTLLTLRQKIQERQKAKEDQPRNLIGGMKKTSSMKKNSPKKAKITTKSTLNKISNF